MIGLATLARPSLPFDETVYIFRGESEFFQAYKDNLKAAKAVASTSHQMYWFGVNFIHFSSECFLKYAYCIVRKQLFQINSKSKKDDLMATWKI